MTFDERRAEISKGTDNTILDYGHQVMYVFPTPDDPGQPFCYTIGRGLADKPEFLITGPLPREVVHYICNAACHMYDEDPTQFADGALLPPDTLLRGFPVNIIAADPRAANMNHALSRFPKTTALQIVWPDMNGNFPGDLGYGYEDDVQPLYPLGS